MIKLVEVSGIGSGKRVSSTDKRNIGIKVWTRGLPLIETV